MVYKPTFNNFAEILSMENIFTCTLPNGIRIVHKELSTTAIVHCGIVLDIGSRDEDETEQGLAHFWEHMVFKGTQKRKAYHIINRLESVGGELNAYTTKEKIAFYASVLGEHFENATELLKDITFNSIFPPKQIEKERGVILEELSMYEDSPEDSLHDEFDEVIFGSHPLGYNILGTRSHIQKFKQNDFRSFINQHLDTHKIVFTCIGNISFKKVKRLAEKYFSDIPETKRKSIRKPFVQSALVNRVIKKPGAQSLAALGKTTISLHDDKRLKLIFLSNLLGGPALNSRLNLSLRERKGLVYSVESSFTPYEDTGMFGVFFGTTPHQLNKSIELVWKEMELLKNKPLGKMQLNSAIEQLKGQMAIAEERNISFMLMMGKSLLNFDKIETLQEIFNKIDNISASEVQDLAHELFVRDSFSSLIYKP